MITDKQQKRNIEKQNLKQLNGSFKVGMDFNLNGKFGEITELLPSGNILIEFPDRTRQVVTHTQLKEGGLI